MVAKIQDLFEEQTPQKIAVEIGIPYQRLVSWMNNPDQETNEIVSKFLKNRKMSTAAELKDYKTTVYRALLKATEEIKRSGQTFFFKVEKKSGYLVPLSSIIRQSQDIFLIKNFERSRFKRLLKQEIQTYIVFIDNCEKLTRREITWIKNVSMGKKIVFIGESLRNQFIPQYIIPCLKNRDFVLILSDQFPFLGKGAIRKMAMYCFNFDSLLRFIAEIENVDFHDVNEIFETIEKKGNWRKEL